MRNLNCLALLAVLAAGCGEGIGPIVSNLEPPAFGVAMTTAVIVRQGMSVQVPVTVSRLAGFTGAIDLSLEGLPVGVTATFSPATVPPAATASALTISASATAAVGPTNVFLFGRATGVVSASLQTTLSVAP